MRSLFSLIFIGLSWLSSPSILAAQVSSCWVTGAPTESTLKHLQTLVTATDSESVAIRDTLSLPYLPADSVQVVTTDAVCSEAITAHLSSAMAPAGINIQAVMLIRVGGSRFVLFDGVTKAGEYKLYHVYSSSFEYLGSYTG